MVLRRISHEQLTLCNEWFNLVETPDDWIDRGPVGEGESQSIKVEHPATRLIGVAKPGPAIASDAECRAAHEKLAFDLAHLLELPVPPVVLWAKDMPNPYVRGRAISAWAFKQAQKWDQAMATGIISDESRISAGPAVSAMRAFHTWISDTDRKSDHTQVNVDSVVGELAVSFIDHAFSMSHVWKAPGAAAGACGAYMPAPEVPDVMAQTADRIAALPDAEVERLVNRIPIPYLPDPGAWAHNCQPVVTQRELACTIRNYMRSPPVADNIMAIYAGRLSLSRITYNCDLQRASGLIIPLGVIAEMTLDTTRALGLIAVTRLEQHERQQIGRLLREQLATPFDYLKHEFDWAWANAPHGLAVKTLAEKHTESLLFATPLVKNVRKAFASKSELLDTVKRELCEYRDQEFKLMMAELTFERSQSPELEESAKLAA